MIRFLLHVKLAYDRILNIVEMGSCSCQDYGSFEDSQTVTTDDGSLNPELRQALESAERRRQEYLDKISIMILSFFLLQYREVRTKRDDPTSPDSESSSSIFTERETSRSEVMFIYPITNTSQITFSSSALQCQTSSSNRVAKSETEEDESSEYVTATDHSPHSPQRISTKKMGPSEDDDVPTSFESFSSPSKSSNQIHAKSSGSSPSSLCTTALLVPWTN
ncbi:uncharacterized protein CEXT_747221 [Caerostris extrusa]|uniref:Uncharacterized protein n=1 Tax=Caerostris extrusa TaxID=172846 RepID=A0AAV4XMA1_CAEEX|nr:uncharacterized protein CEXT_747221 [Caerostris extrusa]